MWQKGLNSVEVGSKWAHFSCLSIPNGLGSILEKRVWDRLFTKFAPKAAPFQGILGFSMGENASTGSKWAKETCLSISNGLGSLLEKHIFDPFLTQFWYPNSPFSRNFGRNHGPKRATTHSKRPKNNSLTISRGLGKTLEIILFFSPWEPRWTQCWPQPCAGWSALRLHQVTTGTGVYASRWAILRLRNHKRWGVAGGLGVGGIRF